MNHTLLVATTNHGKLREFQALLQGLPLNLVSLAEAGCGGKSVVEDGATFAANAIKKAKAYAAETMLLTLADDSGLEVDALHGAPGVRSARFAGERATDAENNTALIRALDALSDSGVEPGISSRRDPFAARFRCVLALVDPFQPDSEPTLADGTCEGQIVRAPRGQGGFGYDPLFLVTGFDRTMAELSPAEKSSVSHRARALSALRPKIAAVLRARDVTADRICSP